jgi:hypothetical protein
MDGVFVERPQQKAGKTNNDLGPVIQKHPETQPNSMVVNFII